MSDSMETKCAPRGHRVIKQLAAQGTCPERAAARRSESQAADRYRLAIIPVVTEMDRVIHNRVPGLCFVRMRWNN
ncbi:hypothetical protein ACFQ07_09605 [Actinomadura adrarensis]|uniref:Uncharacterized protein n=1 Tax=Actinomadura adrarensis TaxID=1819600 RepID=A0ABW3CDH1_9ACTN